MHVRSFLASSNMSNTRMDGRSGLEKQGGAKFCITNQLQGVWKSDKRLLSV